MTHFSIEYKYGSNARIETGSVISIKLNSVGGFTVTNDGAERQTPLIIHGHMIVNGQ